MNFRILHQDQWIVAIDKPAGFQVHQPEDKQHRVSRGFDCIFQLRRQINQYLYPVHRLDRATSGVLVFALDADSARVMSQRFRDKETRKTYFCITRGWVKDEGVFDRPLSSDTPGAEKWEALTRYWKVAHVELSYPVGKYSTARYSLVRVELETGRLHQIRRHFAYDSHPLIGDTLYGDGQHNRFFREKYNSNALFLKAHSLEFAHPANGERIRLESKWNPSWHRAFDLFGACPTR